MAKILLVNPNKWGRGITHIWIASHSGLLKRKHKVKMHKFRILIALLNQFIEKILLHSFFDSVPTSMNRKRVTGSKVYALQHFHQKS